MATAVQTLPKSKVSEFGPDSNVRLKGVTIVKPIVYGTISRTFGKKREDDGHTHTWSCYLRPYTNEDFSKWIKKVQFKLHESYANQIRVVTKPPFEVKETGWGEFEIVIKVFFHDTNERPITIYHQLKLFHLMDPDITSGKRPLVSECYDEIVFQEPTQVLQQLLTEPCNPYDPSAKQWRHETDFELLKKTVLENILKAGEDVQGEIKELQVKLKKSKDAIDVIRTKLGENIDEEVIPP